MQKRNPTLSKTISWLAVSYVLIAGTAWYESGNWKVGLLAALWACVIKTPVYSLHEAIWGKIIFKDAKPVLVVEVVETKDHELDVIVTEECKPAA